MAAAFALRDVVMEDAENISPIVSFADDRVSRHGGDRHSNAAKVTEIALLFSGDSEFLSRN
jgi:hypothetical protein